MTWESFVLKTTSTPYWPISCPEYSWILVPVAFSIRLTIKKIVLEFAVCSWSYIGFSTISNIEILNTLWKSVCCDLSFANVKKLHSSVNAWTDNLNTKGCNFRNRIFETFNDFNRMITLTTVIPKSNRSIIGCTNLRYSDFTMTLLSWLKQTEFTLDVWPVYFLIYLA